MGNEQSIRKKILINKKFQFKYAAMIVATLFVMVALVEWDIFYTMKTILPKVFFMEEIRQDLAAFHLLLAVKSLVFMVLVAFISVYFSHRIAGPIYRLEKDLLHMVNEGDLTKQFRLREKDELKELAEALNTMTANLRTKLLSDEQFREEARIKITEILKILKEKETISAEEKNIVIAKAEEISNASNVSSVSFKI
ncbi:MAG: HAMP domain-containing protein [Elusimicrobia bacterium]|nr:HAMP domain-containing protein [Elusimicrobiota bacterium]